MAAPCRVGVPAVLSGVVLVLAACGDDPAAEAPPEPTAVVTEGSRGVDPFTEPACRAPRSDSEQADRGVERAEAELRRLGMKKFDARYAGVVPCAPEERVVVYRIGGQSRKLEQAAKKVGTKHDVKVAFAAARFTLKQAEQTKDAVLDSFARLDTAGAPFAMLRLHENGTVEVGVRSDVAAAERVLAELLDRIYVVLVPDVGAGVPPAQR